MTFHKIGMIGLGLIGGTLAKTIHRVHPNTSIVAYDINEHGLKQGIAEHVLSEYTTKIDDTFLGCDCLFLCAPVNENTTLLTDLVPYINESCMLSDVGSVKTSIHEMVHQQNLAPYFIGGHPMAGSEKTGYENATPYLFENVYYIVSPTIDVPEKKVAEFIDFIRSLGALPLLLKPDTHDFMTAAISHLPHIIASSLVNIVSQLDDEAETMKTIAAGGFKDITRIASSSPVMWQEICLSNNQQITKLLDTFIQSLNRIKDDIDIKKSEDILDFFQEAKEYRDSITILGNGPIRSTYELYCDLIDEAGGIATISTILASNNISIKNIGIIHNREFQDGVLRIELYEEDELKRSVLLLRKYHYQVYER